MPVSTPSRTVGTSKLKYRESVFVGAFVIEPIKDSVDDTTCILNRDTLACAVPSCVYEVCLSTALFHLLNELFSILCRMKLKECLTEAS
jgi:hypothetical protein